MAKRKHRFGIFGFTRFIKPWHFFVIAVVSGVICVFALRANNLEMVKLRDAVYQADKDNGDVRKAIDNLRKYVFAHMNTDLTSGDNPVRPPIQLKYTYERLVKALAVNNSNNNSDIYTQAQKYCEAAIPNGFSGRYRLSCVQAYIQQHGITTSENIPKSLYEFDFASPRWSPDKAGWSLLVSIFSTLMWLGLGLWRHGIKRLLPKDEEED
jgi:hypothetical protein